MATPDELLALVSQHVEGGRDLATSVSRVDDGIHVASFVAQDLDLVTRMSVEPAGDDGFRLGDLADGQRDLLERQLQILLKALVPEDAIGTGN